jgi:hypothetical protein
VTDSLSNTWGSLTFPIPAADTNLSSLDPARDILLDLFEAALNSELQDAWDMAAGSVDVLARTPVADKLAALPDLDAMRQRKAAFPLLAVARSHEPNAEDEFALWQNRITSKWSIDYVLGPLDVGDQMRLGDVLVAAGKIIPAVIRNGGHKAYATTTLVTPTTGDPLVCAKKVFGPGAGCCGFSTLKVTSFIFGAAAFSQGGPKYHALSMTLETTELDSISEADAVDYTGTAATFGEDLDAAPIEPVVLVEIDTSIPLPADGGGEEAI